VAPALLSTALGAIFFTRFLKHTESREHGTAYSRLTDYHHYHRHHHHRRHREKLTWCIIEKLPTSGEITIRPLAEGKIKQI